MNAWRRIGNCKRCGACCLYLWIEEPTTNLVDHYWETRGALIFPDPLNSENAVVGVIAPCKHIHRHKGGTTYCDIYGTDAYPAGCRNYPPEIGPSVHFALIKRTVGCGFGYTIEEIEEEENVNDDI